MLKNLQTMCALRGVSGEEDEVRAYIADRARPHAAWMRTDSIGNLIVFKKGAKSAENKLMLCAHMDEVGVIVRSVTDEGYLRFDFVGGVDRRVALGKPVELGKNRVPGVIGLKAIHLTTKEERKSVPKQKELTIDIGAGNRAEAETLVAPGDTGTFRSDALVLGENMLKARAIDDRIGCAVMLRLLERELPMDCTFVFTAQEEVGTRGAFGAAFSVRPELALVLEGTTAADLPTVPEGRQVCGPGRGPVIPFMDGGTIYNRELFELLRTLAEENHIPWQTKEYISGGTDARTIQRSRDGVKVAGLSLAVRYLHAPASLASLDDAENMARLAELFVQRISEEC